MANRLDSVPRSWTCGLCGSDNADQIRDLEERVTELETDLLAARSDIDSLGSELDSLIDTVSDYYDFFWDSDTNLSLAIESKTNELRDRIQCLSGNWGNMYVSSDAVDWVNEADPFC